MERDHGQPTPGGQQVDGVLEEPVDLAELVVDGDTQRLERSRRRVPPRLPARHHGLDQRRQRPGRLRQRSGITGAHDGPGDAACLTLLGVIAQNPGQIPLAGARQQLPCGLARPGVHAHVQRPIALKRKTALRIVHLRGGNAQIGEQPVEPTAELQLIERVVEFGERAVEDRHALIRPVALPRRRHGLRVAIGDDQPPARTDALEERLGVAAPAVGGVAIDTASLRPKPLEHRLEQHRPVGLCRLRACLCALICCAHDAPLSLQGEAL